MKRSWLVEESRKGLKAFECKQLTPKLVSVVSNNLAYRILKELAKAPSCAMDIARRLGVHEQKVYYHIRRLEKAGLVKLIGKEQRLGMVAKIYDLSAQAVCVKFSDFATVAKPLHLSQAKVLEPFVSKGKFNSLIVVGSPDPHGRFKAPASDGYGAIVLGTFLGRFLYSMPKEVYKLDTQVTENDRKKNLILVGGAKTNTLVYEINEKMPVRFEYSEELLEWRIRTPSGNVYSDKHVGFVARLVNPFNEKSQILVFAGKGFRGTFASILAFSKRLDELKLEKPGSYHVVKGVDTNSDGMIDDVEILE